MPHFIPLALFLLSAVALAKSTRTVYQFKTKPPRDSHYLEIVAQEDKTTATYFGAEHAGEKDVVFFKAPLADFQKKDTGEVTFTIGQRELCKKPFKPGREKPQACATSSTELLTYKGTLSGDELHLTCQSKHGDCWGDDFFFKRVK